MRERTDIILPIRRRLPKPILKFAEKLQMTYRGLRFGGHFSGLAGLIEAKDDGIGGTVTTGAVKRLKLQSNVTSIKPTPNFLRAGCPSCRPTNSVKAHATDLGLPKQITTV